MLRRIERTTIVQCPCRVGEERLSNRVREIRLFLTGSRLQRLVTWMQEEFPALIYLTLGSDDALTLSDGFLLSRWIRPTFESLGLTSISFPALPKFPLSATDLVYLSLFKIPCSWYNSPGAIVTGLAMMHDDW